MQPEHAQRDIENGASIARGRRTIFYPNAMVMGDTARLEYKHIPWSRHSFRIVCGGFPCQMAAPQGLQLAWDDPRAEQALHFIAAVDANKPYDHLRGGARREGGGDVVVLSEWRRQRPLAALEAEGRPLHAPREHRVVR